MSDPRVVFLGGDGSAPQGLTFADSAHEDSSSWVMWRVLTANNREVGRCQILHHEHADSVADFMDFKAHVERMEQVISHAQVGVEWTWSLLLEEKRGYERLRECHYSLTQFLKAVPVAVVVDDPAHMVRQRRDHAIPGTFEPLADAL
jgi:hypothetical protein